MAGKGSDTAHVLLGFRRFRSTAHAGRPRFEKMGFVAFCARRLAGTGRLGLPSRQPRANLKD